MNKSRIARLQIGILHLLLLLLFAGAVRVQALDSVVIFNEIQYHPPGDASTEWIELRSLHAVDVNMAGWKIQGAVNYTFPADTIIPGGGHLVVAAVPEQIPGAKGPWTGTLNNAGDTVRLVNRNGRVMDEVNYSNGGEWPTGADGSGATLSRRTTSAEPSPSAWTTSTLIGGTPGSLNFYEGAIATRTRLIAIGDPWRYEDSGAPAAAGWQNNGFDDSNWKSGATLISGGGGKLNNATLKPSALPTGLLAYWSFDETSGTVAANGVAGQLNGTMANGASFVSDATRGRVANFDGLDDRMEVIDTGTSLPSTTFLPMMTSTNDFTWAAWVWSSTASTLSDQFGSVILGNRTGPTGADTTPREFIKIMPTAMQYHRNAATENLDYDDLPTSKWTHICVVKRGLSLDCYLNGVFAVTRTLTGGLSNALPFYVGGDRSGSAEHFQGRVDDVGLWTRALSSSEIAQIGTPPPGPVLPTPPEQTTTATAGPEPRYFRKTFTFTGTPSAASLELWPVADDGAVIYLNGTEVWRANVPPASEVGDATFTPVPISIPNTALLNGSNVLSAEVHQFPGGNNDLLFGAELVITSVPGPAPAAPPSLVFNEIAGSGDGGFFIELRNTSGAAVDTTGWLLKTSTGAMVSLPTQNVPAGGYASFAGADLGFIPANGMRLFLLAPGGTELRDSREIKNRLTGFLPDGRWGFPSSSTPGGANVVTVTDAVVINEIFYHAPGASLEQWIELYNKSTDAVELSGWRFTEGIDFNFQTGTSIPAGGYLVIAWDPSAFTALHPGVTAIGPWVGNLSGKGEVIRLRDANGNVADEVAYADDGRWSNWADGGGSSLELMDPRADNSKGEAWDSSDESSRSTWQNVSYTGSGANVGNDPTSWSELCLGLLDSGECLIDDISVREDPAGTNVELIQNGTFGSGTADKWRIIGTHRYSTVVDDPLSPGNKVLKLVCDGTTEHMNNHAETTLKRGATLLGANGIDGTKQYTVSFRAKWLRGSNRLHSRFYFNRLARQTLLNMPTTGGTPGAVNSRRVSNLGPTFEALRHSPVVPLVGQSAIVSVKVSDPDNVSGVQLFTSINGAAFNSTAMAETDGVYSATIPAQATSTLVQFYIQAVDGLGAVSVFPAAGVNSRAMIPWNDGRAALTLPSGVHPHNVRIVVKSADATDMYKLENVMSNEERPCTVIIDEHDVYYRAKVRLKSSEHGRYQENRVGFKLSFGSDEKFLGVHEDVSLDRSGGVVAGQREILIKAVSNSAGGIYATEDDIARVIPPVAPPGGGIAFSGTGVLGAALFSRSRFDDEYLDAQWADGGSGPLFKYELHYPLTQTIDPVTRVVGTLPENPKIPQDTTGPSGVPVANIGADKELYRWHWLIRNGRTEDDYSKLIAAVTAVGQASSAAFQTQTTQTLETSTWLRACVPPALFGVIDNYLGDNAGHNALLYFPPGGKGVMIPWDMDFLSQGNAQASLAVGGNLSKWLAIPVNKRTYYGHLLDVLNRSFNSAFLTRWAQHYSKFGTDDMTSSLPYLNARAQYANNVVNGTGGQIAPIAVVPFRITTPNPTTSSSPFLTLIGDGWIDVAEIRLAGSTVPFNDTWTDDNSWSLQLPVKAGTNTYTLQAYNTSGAQVGTASIEITGSGGVFPASTGSLVVSELNYNPPGGDDATEFIELLNITGAVLDMGGCHFDQVLGSGIAYTFQPGVQVAAGGRILIVRDRAAFTAAYPTAGPLAPLQFSGSFDNSGGTVVLYASDGTEVFRFTYADNVAGTDGDGRTLVRVLSSTNPDPQSYVWRASTSNGGNPGSSDAAAFAGVPDADLDGDGLPALLEYTFGTSDLVVENPLPWSISNDPLGNQFFEVRRAVNADDTVLSFEGTSDLGGAWQPAAATLFSSVVDGTVATETWLITPPSGSQNYYFRAKATLR